ncbi:hypothetical protein [Rhizobium sp. 18055]|uniref:hypothetical protein n=1 Tax=Rhizobium sp. 18055 TaxID=2681403 RepID=UPI00135A71D2|nr:hypothetical protein [Rhizobium sp. 18055]
MFLSRYNDRPSTLKVDHEIATNVNIDLENETITKERKATVHSLNDFNITVWDDGEVTAQRKHYVSTDPGRHFPNMSVVDGAINFPIEDLVSFVLDRVTPEELADGIMADDEARAGLVYKMSERYASPGFEDADRREFLTKVQQAIHAKSVDRAIERLNTMESNARAFSDRDRWRGIELGHYKGLFDRYTEALYELREAGKLDDAGVQRRKGQHTSPDRLEEYIKENKDPVATESVGAQWYESRDFWRAELLKYFPEPVEAPAEVGGDL